MRKIRPGRIFWIGAAIAFTAAALVVVMARARGSDLGSDYNSQFFTVLLASFSAWSIVLGGLRLVQVDRLVALGWFVVSTAPVFLALCLRLALDPGFAGTFSEPAASVKHWGWTGFLGLVAELLVVSTALLSRGRVGAALVGASCVAAGLGFAFASLAVRAEGAEPSAWILGAAGACLLAALLTLAIAGITRILRR